MHGTADRTSRCTGGSTGSRTGSSATSTPRSRSPPTLAPLTRRRSPRFDLLHRFLLRFRFRFRLRLRLSPGLGLHALGQLLPSRLAVPFLVGLVRDLPFHQERRE